MDSGITTMELTYTPCSTEQAAGRLRRKPAPAPFRAVVYHGASEFFGAFDHRLAGSATKAPLAWLGVFFTPDIDLARKFCRKNWNKPHSKLREGATLVTAEISFARPYVMDTYEFLSLSNVKDQVIWKRECLIDRGHDGIIVEAFPDNDPTGELHVPQYVALDVQTIRILTQEPMAGGPRRNGVGGSGGGGNERSGKISPRI